MRKKQILVVEDNELNREILCGILSEEYRVLEAENGLAALDMLRKNADDISLILLDIMMPVMNGLEATRAIRSSGRSDYSVPIIAMTANAYEEDKKECIEAGMNEHIAKPLEESEIMAAIKRNI